MTPKDIYKHFDDSLARDNLASADSADFEKSVQSDKNIYTNEKI